MHPLVAAWFDRRFHAPTEAQVRAFPLIAAGNDVLITAPTGSGKTLAAFLMCLDKLVGEALSTGLRDETYVVYVSPLKALSNDVQKNLDQPIAELRALATELGMPEPLIRTAVRTGDTPMAERQKLGKKPPHVLVTTPESFYILLTSASGRRALQRTRALILDEIHAVAPDKRGAHLAISVERLDDLVTRAGNPRPQRIGLSATVEPMSVASRLLVGSSPLPAIVDTGRKRAFDFAIEIPRDELGAVSTNEQWEELYDRVAALANEHQSTLVFTNTRRLVERLAHRLGERLGEGVVAAHHGSLSRTRRLAAEQKLKAGELKVVVATGSLELGIDVGAVELVCLVGSPRSVATAVQRAGRSGHVVGGTPKARFFPLTRDQLVECATIVRAAKRQMLDPVRLRDAPLDVMAQQIVAIVAAEERREDEVFSLVTRAAPYQALDRAVFDQVVAMLAEGPSTRRGRAGALVHRDQVNGLLRGRRGSRLTAITSGGAIPDNANYDVLSLPEGTRVGTIEEDFAIESMAGDVFLLGSTSWRIRRVEMGKVWVEDARGATPTIPFWLGEAPARSFELGAELSRLREDIVAKVEQDGIASAITWLMDACALDAAGARLACEYIAAGKAMLGHVPTVETIVAERFFDEAGGMQLVLHAPFGGRINRALGLALRKRFCRSFDFELQAAATDDGVLLSLGPQHSFPLESLLDLLRPDDVRDVLTQAALQAPMFGTRFRWNASRSLMLLRFSGGKKVPAPLQRMRSDDLLASVFPAQQGCQDNHGIGAHVDPPDHPIVNETIRDCLVEVMDAEGLADVLRRVRDGRVRFLGRDTPEPSVLSHEILNASPYAFLDDAPLEERRARAVTVRRGLPPEVAERMGGLDPEAITSVVREAQPIARDEDELHDVLLDQCVMPESEGRARGFDLLFEGLVASRRAAVLDGEGSIRLWFAAERKTLVDAVWPGRASTPMVVDPAPKPVEPEIAVAAVIRGRLAIMGPLTEAEIARDVGLSPADVAIGLARLEGEGGILRGQFRPSASKDEIEWCDRRLLSRIHRRTVDGLRRAIEPVSAADLMRFLFAWQGVAGDKRAGQDGLSRVIDLLQGFEAAAGAWEAELLPSRLRGYEPAWLDALCLSGEVAWGRSAAREAGKAAPTKTALITLMKRRDLPWLLAAGPESEPVRDDALSEAARKALSFLKENGASFFEEMVMAGQDRSALEDALWELTAAGRITGDGFGGLRVLIDRDVAREAPWKVGRLRGPKAPVAAGRWSLLRALPIPYEAVVEARAKQYLKRYGVVMRDLLAREGNAPPWRDLVKVYRVMEMRGEIRGGRLVASFVGEQFALPEAVDALRAVRRAPLKGEVVTVSACDPLNLAGIITPGAKVPAHLGAKVSYRDGVPLSQDEEPESVAAAE